MVVNLKRLLHRELGEGMTEEELATAVKLPVNIVVDILSDRLPQDPKVWEAFAAYFRIEADFLRYGVPSHVEGLFELTKETEQASVGQIRKVPLLKWHQIDKMVEGDEPPRLIHAEGLLETDVPGKRIFAVQVRDDSMQPLFSEGEIIFVNPDLTGEPGQYVMVEGEEGGQAGLLLRELRAVGGQAMLHPLNRRYEDLPLTKQHRIVGRVVRLRKNV